jgi:hypothetical protein
MIVGVGRADELNRVADYLQQQSMPIDPANLVLGVSTIAAGARCWSADRRDGRVSCGAAAPWARAAIA